MQAYWHSHPRQIGRAQWLWNHTKGQQGSFYSGPALEQARADAKRSMDAITDGDDVPALFAIERGSAPGIEAQVRAAHKRLRELEGPAPDDLAWARAIQEANGHTDPAVALARLDAVGLTLPTDGSARRMLEGNRYERLVTLGRPEEALTAAERFWRASSDVDSAEWFARLASSNQSMRGVGLQASVEALDAHRRGRFAPDWDAKAVGEATDWPTQHERWVAWHREKERKLLDIVRWYQHESSIPMTPYPPPHDLDAALYWAEGLLHEDRLADQFLIRAAVLDPTRQQAVVDELEPAMNSPTWSYRAAFHPHPSRSTDRCTPSTTTQVCGWSISGRPGVLPASLP
jgi:hypothetical protein